MSAARLEQLAHGAGLTSRVSRAALGQAAHSINTALEQYVLWVTVAENNGPASAKRDWASGLALTCHDLIVGLGGDAFQGRYDARRHLEEAWPSKPEEQGTLHRLEGHLRHAMPEAWGMHWQSGEGTQPRKLFWESFDRLIHTLRAVLLLAERTEARARTKAKRGGSNQEVALRALMVRLALSYREMFGDVPKVVTRHTKGGRGRRTTPAGPTMEWHLGLFRTIRDCCRQPAPPDNRGPVAPLSGDRSPETLITSRVAQPEYAVLAKLADRALGVQNGYQKNTRDALAGWIRNAVAELRRREASGAAVPRPNADFDD